MNGTRQWRSLSTVLFTFVVDSDEKHDQKATVNNSFCSKTKPAGPLGNKGGG